MTFAELVSRYRKDQFRSPREAHIHAQLACSYSHYLNIERGLATDVETAIDIIRKLGIPLKTGLFAYLASIMPDQESQELFRAERDVDIMAKPMTVENSVTINHAQCALLNENPVHLEIASFLACYYKRSFSIKELAQHFKMGQAELAKMLGKLEGNGLVMINEQGRYQTKEWVYLPQGQQFLGFRDQIVGRAIEKYHQQPSDKWTKVVTRLLTPDQKHLVEQMLDEVCDRIVALDETDAKTARPVSIGLFASWRTFGNA